MTRILIALFTVTLFFACENTEKPPVTEEASEEEMVMVADSIIYEIKTAEDQYCIHNSTTKDTLCAEADAKYIVLQRGFNDAATQKIQTSLKGMIGEDSLSIEEILAQSNREIDEFKEEESDYWPMGYAYSVSQKTELNTPELLTGASFLYSYMGGAHGSYYTDNFNFNAQTGERIAWQSLFTDTLQVYGVAQKSLATMERLDGEDIHEYFSFPDDKFYLTDNYILSEDKLTFFYSIYEIASYADREIEIALPYTEIKDLLKKGTALDFYLENKR